MKSFYLSIFLFLFVICFSFKQTLACTTFCLKGKGEVLFGRNYDWAIGDGLVMINKRGVQKVSVADEADNPAKWVSKYGSITFNQYGRENPMGGMNEAGLVVELMWLDETRYSENKNYPTIDVLEWIQNQLDTAATVDEVIKNAEQIRIISRAKIHYLVNDKNGGSATIEFLDGKLIAQKGVSALANDTYDKSLNYSKTTPLERAKSQSSFDRFTRAAEKTKEFEKQPKTEQEAVNYAFDVLANVAQTGSTQWSIVYDQKRGKVYFRTLKSSTIKSVEMKGFDYSCGTTVKIFEIDSKDSGDVTAKFIDYTQEANRNLIERSYSGTDFLKEVPKTYKDFAAAYPEKFACDVESKKAENESVKSDEKTGFFYSIYQFFFGV